MEISCHITENTGFVNLIGQLWQKEDITSVEEAVDNFLKNNILKIVMDFDRLGFINSAGLGLIAKLHTHIRDAGGKMILFSPHSSVLDVIEISGFDLFMTIVTTKEELDSLLH